MTIVGTQAYFIPTSYKAPGKRGESSEFSLPASDDAKAMPAERSLLVTGSPSNPLASLSKAMWENLAEPKESGDNTGDEFRRWAQMSVAEKIEAKIWERKGLTKEKLEAMPPEEKKAILEEVADEVKRTVEESLGHAVNTDSEATAAETARME